MTQLLKVTDLHVVFHTNGSVVQANRGINLCLDEGESLGIMGESGCGKTVFLLSLMRLQQPGKIVKGSILYDGVELTRISENAIQRYRGRDIALIPQNHNMAFNPSFSIGEQLGEALKIRSNSSSLWNTIYIRQSAWDTQAISELDSLLRDLGLDDVAKMGKLLQRYPHQLSGGMRQRLLVAMALLTHPRLLIADEPTTALDSGTRKQMIEILSALHGRMALLIVSHDLDVISSTCDHVSVMYGGRIVESGPAEELFQRPLHPYTRCLISCQRPERGKSLPSVSGDVLDLINFPPGCEFQPRCPLSTPICSEVIPEEIQVGNIKVACHIYSREMTQ